MNRALVLGILLSCLTSLDAQGEKMTFLDAGPLRVGLSDSGRIAGLVYTPTGTDYAPQGRDTPLLSVSADGRDLQPTSMQYDDAQRVLRLAYGDSGIGATLRATPCATHLDLELLAVEGVVPTRIDWGPFETTVGATVGETVGVVRDGTVAFGIQALNVQTVGSAAKTDTGSRLSAHAIEHEGGVRGSRIALFACPADQALETIGKIEVAAGLPHPMLDGVWGKVSPTARLSYLICPFGEKNLDFVLEQAARAGLTYLYHPGPFATWGHFRLDPGEFPDGDESMARCVKRAAEHGVRLGVHTLTGFITTNDPYVTPVPDPRLGRSGSSTLSAAVDATTGEIPIASPDEFRRRVPWDKPLNTAIIGQELVQYQAISQEAPWRLVGCSRGAWGTRASAHEAGADIGRLADHAYNTFYPGIDNGMMDEMTARLAELINKTGLRQTSYDGLEGLSAYGYGGDYSRNRFVKQCYDASEYEVISDASNCLHYLWHIHTRMNWGEPWGKAMREGMAEYRFKNQEYFQRNLLPGMLGWWELRTTSGDLEATTLEDFEWMYARSAGFDAGFAITSSTGALKANAQSPAILAACREWEAARHAKAFSAAQREMLRDPSTEWHLEAVGEGRWRLIPLDITRLNGLRGEVSNRFAAQRIRFVLRTPPGKGRAPVRNVRCRVGDTEAVFAVQMKPGQYLVCDGQPAAFVCDANWNVVCSAKPAGDLPTLATGTQRVEFVVDGGADVQATVKLVGPPENVEAQPES